MMERKALLSQFELREDIEQDGEGEGSHTYEEAINTAGFGRFHFWLILIGGLANASDAIEILCVSILLPAAECDLKMTSADKGWLNAMLFLGMMLGGYIWGSLGDIYGRRNILIVSLLVNAIAGILSAFAQGFPLFLTFRFISGLGVGGSIPLVWAYISEFQPPHKRGQALSIIASFWMVGNVVVAGTALGIIPLHIGFVSGNFKFNSWRIFLVICALPALTISLAIVLLPESPMFLLLKGQHNDALAIIRNVYKQNHGQQSHFPVTSIDFPVMKLNTDNSGSWLGSIKRAVEQTLKQTVSLFAPSLLRVTTIMLLINFAIQFGYYGLWLWFPELFNRLEQFYADHPDMKASVCEMTHMNLNSTAKQVCQEDEGDEVNYQALVNILITSIAPLPANVWTIVHMDKFGRKFFLILSMTLAGVSAFGIYLVQTSLHNLILGCIFGAVTTMGFNALDCLGAELFPTHLRSTALAVTLLAARVGAIIGSIIFGYLLDVYCAIPILLVSGFLVFGGLLVLLLPNTTRVALT
ncbi:synaptic vesicle glycoprotein 2B-like isoform X2 [Oratosquilla oratoria]|uniref:synaptic vesicle glycoprotein 2B-like isoform X2 n=1 Tax=Oratosquilla oratoria TaxID=337810 RepID=UPI003F75D921